MERKLFRSETNRVFLGVCGGIGEYFNLDPVLIRVITVVITILTGFFPGVIAYFAIALIVPNEDSVTKNPRGQFRQNLNEMKDTTSKLGEEIRNTFTQKESQSSSGKETRPVTQGPYSPTRSALYILGIIIILIGVMILLGDLFGWLTRFLWPLLLIVAGILIVLLVIRRRK